MKIKIQTISTWNIIVTIVVTLLFTAISQQGKQEFGVYQTATEQYIDCADAAGQLQEGSDYLTEQARLYVMTGMSQYMEGYFREANVTKRREAAVDELGIYFSDTTAFTSLEEALTHSRELMQTEYYAMRLMAESLMQQKAPDGTAFAAWAEEIIQTELTEADSQLSQKQKCEEAQKLLSDSEYLAMKEKITADISNCTSELKLQTKMKQHAAVEIFSKQYQLLEFAIIPLVLLMLFSCVMIRAWIVKPLCDYNACIQRGEAFPLAFAYELRNLAETYNEVCRENNAIQGQLQYEADHDALTGLFNRGSFEKIQRDKRRSKESFALILVDVDIFKSINDNYGHAVGDQVLKKVAALLKSGFRNIDYACRVGGDEFAVIMVDVTEKQRETICERLDDIRKKLRIQDEKLPQITLSMGVAFSDESDLEDNIFTRADQALYYIKEHGRDGYTFFDAAIHSV